MSNATYEVTICIRMINGDRGAVDIHSEGLKTLREVDQVIERARSMARTMARREEPLPAAMMSLPIRVANN